MATSSMIYPLSDWQIGTLVAYCNYVYHPDNGLKVDIQHIGLSDDGYLIIEYIQNGKIEVHKIPRVPNQTPKEWNFKPEINPYE